MNGRALVGLARADFRERVRRPAFLATLAATLWLAGGVVRGQVRMHVGEWRGVYDSTWIGVLMAMSAGLFVSLVGFYVVKGSVDRDRTTRVGQVLAATRVSRPLYTIGKAASNLAVFGVVLAVLTAAGLVMQLLAGEDRHVDVWRLVVPMLVFALPAVAVTAALAVLFECIPFLAGGFGNVAYFFLWGALMSVPLSSGRGEMDVLGIAPVEQSLTAAVRALDPASKDGFSLNAGPDVERAKKTFRWDGIPVTGRLLAQRALCMAFAFALVLLSAFFFDRFDRAPGTLRRKKSKAASKADAAAALAAAGTPRPAAHLTPIPPGPFRARMPALVAAELRLLLRGVRWWWLLGAAGFVIGTLNAPLATARHEVLACAWLWPVLLWSGLGSREARNGTEALVFSVPRPIGRQLVAAWLAGSVVAVALAAGVLVRVAAAGEGRGVAAILFGALYVPSLALALGAWSGTAKLFEGLYTALWYIGPIQGTPAPALDFIGGAPATLATGIPFAYLAAAIALVALAALGRKWRMSRL